MRMFDIERESKLYDHQLRQTIVTEGEEILLVSTIRTPYPDPDCGFDSQYETAIVINVNMEGERGSFSEDDLIWRYGSDTEAQARIIHIAGKWNAASLIRGTH